MTASESDGSWSAAAVGRTVFRPGLFSAVGPVVLVWLGTVMALAGGRRIRVRPHQPAPLWAVVAGVAIATLLSAGLVLRVLLTRVVVGGAEVVVRRPGLPTRRFRRGATLLSGHLTVRGSDGPAIDLPSWWLTAPDVERLAASVESELGARFPDRPPAPQRRPRGEPQW